MEIFQSGNNMRHLIETHQYIPDYVTGFHKGRGMMWLSLRNLLSVYNLICFQI